MLEQAIGYTLGSLQLVRDAALSRATPCASWTLRDLLAHLDDSLQALDEAVVVRRVDLTPGAGAQGPDLVASLRRRASQMMGHWAQARGVDPVAVGDLTLPADLVGAAGAIEVAVHGWDVAAACGAPRPIPAGLALDLLAVGRAVLDPADRAGRFAAPIETSTSATPNARLLAFLGRVPYHPN
ncbi:MAG: TIGR03086 family metal-binding protein [Nocardioidaceae bacterium]